ncbi:MAG: type II toxin-antitoxin system RelE family toxin [Candidatus Nanoarchaeia archaeon]
MYSYNLTDELRKKIEILSKKDKVLAQIFYKKIQEIINRDAEGLNSYKNLRSPLNEYKRIHLTSNYVLLFSVDSKNKQKNKHIVFIDILHRDRVYGK